MSEPLEVARELEALRARVRGAAAQPAGEMTPLRKALAYVNANWHVSAALPAPVNAPFLWRAAHCARRLARRAVIQVLSTVVQEQNAFNAHAAQALTELARENAELRARLDQLERRLKDECQKTR